MRPNPLPRPLSGVAGALGLLVCAATAWAQSSPSAQVTVDLPGGAAAAGRAGATVVFGAGPLDALDQPALPADARGVQVDAAVGFDRYFDGRADPWAVGVVAPLGAPDDDRPVLTVAHRRVRGDDLPVPGLDRFYFDLDHDLTSLGLATRLPGTWGRRIHAGVMLHTVSKSGLSGLTLRTATIDSTVVPEGFDDLLFAASVGVIYVAPPVPVASGDLSWRAGVALRRIGEDVDVRRITFAREGSPTLGVDRRSALATAVALGGGAAWAGPDVGLVLAGEVVLPTYDGAPDRERWVFGLETTFHGLLTLRTGVRDDDRGTGWTFGAGVRTPPWRRVALSLDVAHEPSRFEPLGDDALVVGLSLHVDLQDDDPDDPLDELFDDLDRLDDWIDEGATAPADTTKTPGSEDLP